MKTVICFLITIWLLMNRQLLGQSVYVPLQHWAYDFVERMETKGLIRSVLNGTRPYSREEMARYLLDVERDIQNGAGSLTSVELKQLDFLKFEFREELQLIGDKDSDIYSSRIAKIKKGTWLGRAVPDFLYKNNRNLLTFEGKDFKAFIDPIFYQQWLYANPDTVAGTERVFEQTHGFTLRGNLGSIVGFFFDFRDTKEWGTRAYPKALDSITLPGLGFVNGYGTHIWHDETNGYLMFRLPYMQLMFGKDWNSWGPGANGSLGLSNYATSYDQIKLQSRVWRLKFTWLLGFLRPFPRLVDSQGNMRAKNIVAHRLEIDVAPWLDVGLYEMVIFGNRRFELAYLNPINFYRSAEHFLADDDNASLGADVEFLLIPSTKLYGEYYLDDRVSSFGSNYFGNKMGLLAGALWVDAFTIPNLDARLEYTRTRPYLYTHREPVNSYTHFGSVLGHWIGPNADLLSITMNYRLSLSLDVSMQYQHWRHGANTSDRNIGGDVKRPFEDGGSAYVGFLDGELEESNMFRFEARYEVFRNLYVNLAMARTTSENILPSDGVRTNSDRNEVFFNISLNR